MSAFTPGDEEEACSTCGPNVNQAMMNSSVSGAQTAAGRPEDREPCSWFEISYLIKELATKAGGKKYDCVLGIGNGGIIPARLLAEELGLDEIQLVPVRNKQVVFAEMPNLDKKKRYLVVDDIYDTGSTYEKVSKALMGYKCDFAFCMSRYDQDAGISGRVLNHGRWIVFPWESPDRK